MICIYSYKLGSRKPHYKRLHNTGCRLAIKRAAGHSAIATRQTYPDYSKSELMETCNLNTVTSFYIVEELILLLQITVYGLIAIVVAVAISVGSRWIAKLVQFILQAPASAQESQFFNDSRKVPANDMAPMQEISTDKGELVISSVNKK